MLRPREVPVPGYVARGPELSCTFLLQICHVQGPMLQSWHVQCWKLATFGTSPRAGDTNKRHQDKARGVLRHSHVAHRHRQNPGTLRVWLDSRTPEPDGLEPRRCGADSTCAMKIRRMHVLTYLRHIPLHPSMTTDNITCAQLWQQGVRLLFLPFSWLLSFNVFRKTKKQKT